jgi:hypothetical protein
MTSAKKENDMRIWKPAKGCILRLTEEKEKEKESSELGRTQIDEAKVDDAIVDLNVEDVAAARKW